MAGILLASKDMKILIVDSSKKRAYVEVLKDEETFAYTLLETEKHSENLLLRIEEQIEKSNLKLSDFDAYASVVGPGSFTGIRVGISTLKAFNFVNNKKIITVNSFEPFLELVKKGVILLNSTRTTFYYAKVVNHKISDMGTVSIDDLFDFIKGQEIYMLDFDRFNELEKYKVNYVDNYGELLRNIVVRKFKNQKFTNDNEFEPLYLQLSQAEVQLKNKSK